VLTVGHKNQELLGVLHKKFEEAEELRKQLALLQEERETLNQNRKQLPAEKQQQLMKLQLQERLLSKEPDYLNSDADRYDDLNFNVANEIVKFVVFFVTTCRLTPCWLNKRNLKLKWPVMRAFPRRRLKRSERG